jgi:CubicO group peptidase (beta-lactamase class C family)
VSVSKLLAGLAALVAVEEGAVDLDEPAGPDGSTVRHLFAHTSGPVFDAGTVRPLRRGGGTPRRVANRTSTT